MASWSPIFSRVVSSMRMPRSRAIGRRGDDVDVGEHRAQQAGDGGAGQRLRLHVGDVALIDDADRLDAALGELAGEGAELLGQRDEGPQLRRFLGGDRGEVHGVLDGAAQEVVRHLLGDLQRDVLLRLGGRRRRDAACRRRWAGRTAGFALAGSSMKTSKAAPATWPRLDELGERLLVDEAAAGAVDDAHALAGLRRAPRATGCSWSAASSACAA